MRKSDAVNPKDSEPGPLESPPARTTLMTPSSAGDPDASFIRAAVISRLATPQLLELMGLVTAELKQRYEPAVPGMSTGSLLPERAPEIIDKPVEIPESEYISLPARLANDPEKERLAWRITLVHADSRHRVLALRVLGDVIIGRKVKGVEPDLDLDPYDMGQAGISRIHALMRSSADQLQLSDLGSTNGTYVDGERLAVGRVITLRDKATISFGKAHFKLNIVQRPKSASS